MRGQNRNHLSWGMRVLLGVISAVLTLWTASLLSMSSISLRLEEGTDPHRFFPPFSNNNPRHQNFNNDAALEEEIRKLRGELQQARDQLQHPQHNYDSDEKAPDSSSDSSSTLSSSPPICQDWLRTLQVSSNFQYWPSSLNLWNSHLTKIHAASQHERDLRYAFSDFTAELLQLVSDRLPYSIKSLPRGEQWHQVERILRLVHDRYRYLQLPPEQRSQQKEPRKVRIAVMGGSLLVGVNCRKVVKELGLQMQLPNRLCTWAHRLEAFLNSMILSSSPLEYEHTGNDQIFEVDKISLGGTNTGMGAVVYKYGLIPHPKPDIVINAYATNDMHVLTVLEAKSQNQTLRDKVFDMTQDYIRTIFKSSHRGSSSSDHCPQRHHTPLLLHMDDYLGNEQRQIWSTTELSQGVGVLANYYGFASMSYSDVVRDLVYGNTHERWFSPGAWYEKDGRPSRTMEREIHPGMAMHITSTWVTAFNLLHAALHFCSLQPSTLTSHQGGDEIPYQVGPGVPPLQGKSIPKGKPEHPPLVLPPLLTKTLDLENISQLWHQDAVNHQTKDDQCPDDNEEENYQPCLFAWVSGLSQMQLNVTYIRELFEERTIENTGWQVVDDEHKKTGFHPTGGLHSRLALEFSNVKQHVSVVTFFYMKSYGALWSGSRVKITVSFPKRELSDSVIELVGVHDKNTSETYTEEIQLADGGIPVGSDLRVSMELVDGTIFKLQGLAVCS